MRHRRGEGQVRDRPVVCLMGPTAAGKTELAVRLQQHAPFDIVSVDSALVYRCMNIGTAKPDPDTLAEAPHRLIDIRDPEQSYSAGDFVRDAYVEIETIHDLGRVPLLVGGTMMYFRALTEGLAELPAANPTIRARLDAEAAQHGWHYLHRRLARIDPRAAARINRNDSQRIQRGLEVYEVSGQALSTWQLDARPLKPDYRFIKLAVVAANRQKLHFRIETRLQQMLSQGFVEEVRGLMRRPGLSAASPSMRAVGYRQIWDYLGGKSSRQEAQLKVLAATRQLAKRQMTWLRTETHLKTFESLEGDPFDTILTYVTKQMDE